MDLALGEFRLDTVRRMLWRGQAYVPLGARAYAILSALVDVPGAVVSKDTLIERAWPGIVVDGANLRVQVAKLRKALGEQGAHIVAEQSKGYRYAGEVRRVAGSGTSEIVRRFNAPVSLKPPLGREKALESIFKALDQFRLITIVGPGGIGKTTLALEIAAHIADRFTDGVCFVDLCLASDAGTVASAVAAALERPVMDNPLGDVLTFLKTRRALIVLDCCERVIEDAAEIATKILSEAPGIAIVSTSREVMRAAGEFVEHLDGLQMAEDGPLPLDEASRFGSIELFERTAQSASSNFQLTDENAQLVAEICRKLDGIPLAIELAAGLTSAIGLDQIKDGLNERLSILTFGRRGGLPRHRTLDAAIGWSYDTLNEKEATTLRRLSVFADTFGLKGALEVISFGSLDRGDVQTAVVALAQKSLVNVEIKKETAEYRLLETTRHFASSRLASMGELKQVASKYAEYLIRLLEHVEWETLEFISNRREALSLAAGVKEALDWAYTESPDELLAIRLTVAAERLWLELGLLQEHGARMNQARSHLTRIGRQNSDYAALEAAVLSGIAYGVFYHTADHERIKVILEALRRTKDVGDRKRYLRNLSYAYFYYVLRNQGHEALNIAEQLRSEATEDKDLDVVAFATVAAANARTQIGDWRQSQIYLEGYLGGGRLAVSREATIYFGFNTTVFALYALAIVEGSEGNSARCFECLDRALALTENSHEAQARFQLLYIAACRMAFRCGDIPRARHYLDLLEQQARDFAPWQFMTLPYLGWMAFIEGRLQDAETLLNRYFSSTNPLGATSGSFYLVLADVRRQRGDLEGAERAVAAGYSLRSGEDDPFMVGPSQRVRADILVAGGAKQKTNEAKELYHRAIENARRYGAIGFEVPAAVGLATLEISQGNPGAACEVLDGLITRSPIGQDFQPMHGVLKLLHQARDAISHSGS